LSLRDYAINYPFHPSYPYRAVASPFPHLPSFHRHPSFAVVAVAAFAFAFLDPYPFHLLHLDSPFHRPYRVVGSTHSSLIVVEIYSWSVADWWGNERMGSVQKRPWEVEGRFDGLIWESERVVVLSVLSSASNVCTMVCMTDNDTIEKYKYKRWKVVLRIEAVFE
jgi:hypothetical protein